MFQNILIAQDENHSYESWTHALLVFLPLSLELCEVDSLSSQLFLSCLVSKSLPWFLSFFLLQHLLLGYLRIHETLPLNWVFRDLISTGNGLGCTLGCTTVDYRCCRGWCSVMIDMSESTFFSSWCYSLLNRHKITIGCALRNSHQTDFWFPILSATIHHKTQNKSVGS